MLRLTLSRKGTRQIDNDGWRYLQGAGHYDVAHNLHGL